MTTNGVRHLRYHLGALGIALAGTAALFAHATLVCGLPDPRASWGRRFLFVLAPERAGIILTLALAALVAAAALAALAEPLLRAGRIGAVLLGALAGAVAGPAAGWALCPPGLPAATMLTMALLGAGSGACFAWGIRPGWAAYPAGEGCRARA